MQVGQVMDRRGDSGFDASWHMKATNIDTARIVPETTNTVPTRPRRHAKVTSDSSSKPQIKTMPDSHPSSNKSPSAARTSTAEIRRPSICSSSEGSTTRTRSRGHGSRHSSRRTSRTIVDPSRPTRHYRITSSHTIPTVNRNDIDDVIALHFRSCSLFENPSYYSPMASPIGTGERESVAGSKPLPLSEQTDYMTSNNPQALSKETSPKPSEEIIMPAERANTTMHWMSPSTRRRQYDKIDKANSGLRCLIGRIVPRCVSGPPPQRFYEKDQSDTGSVRRYRISDDIEDEKEPQIQNEKDLETSTLTIRSRQIRTLDRSLIQPPMKTKRWGCF